MHNNAMKMHNRYAVLNVSHSSTYHSRVRTQVLLIFWKHFRASVTSAFTQKDPVSETDVLR